MGWLIAIVLAIFLAQARGQLRRVLRAQRTQDDEARAARGVPQLEPLVVLRLDLGRRQQAGELGQAQYQQLVQAVDELCSSRLEALALAPDSEQWREHSVTAWRTLVAHGLVPSGPAPWEGPPPGVRLPPVGAGCAPTPEPQEGRAPQPAPGVVAQPIQPQAAVGRDGEQAPAMAPAVGAFAPVPAVSPAAPGALSQGGMRHAWEAAPPSALEKMLRAVSGWPRAALPFLLQNIGWFIGGFCFLAGSVFLVSYTTGLAKGLTVFAAVFAYTSFLLWAGYRLRLKRPAVKAGSAVLMTLGLLLVPLNIAAGVRLMVSTGASPAQLAVGLLVTTLALGVYYLAGQVVGGVMDRTLQRGYARIFLLLSAAQLAVPLVARWPHWTLLAAAHLTLLAILGFGLLRYAHHWMQSIFVERRQIAYFAAGSLLYAALVSFVHLTWGAAPLAVPAGYYAPYLMMVCGLLFYVDAHFKHWAYRYVFLSRFTFLIYGLSAVAVALSLDGPAARLITLSLAALIYAIVVWKYLTLAPLYLLLASVASLYALLVLGHVPARWHFLASLPGLLLLWGVYRWAWRRGAFALTLAAYRILVFALSALAVWSLWHAPPGLTAAASASTLAGALWWLLGAAPGPLLGAIQAGGSPPVVSAARTDLRNSPWLYGVTVALSAALAFAPPWGRLDWGLRFAVGLMLLACLWAGLAICSHRGRRGVRAAQTEVYANSALLSIAGGLACALMVLPEGRSWWGLLGGMCAVGGGALLWLSLGLYTQWLFYGFLALVAAGGVVTKLAFFPAPSSGGPEVLVGLALWGVLWWLDRQPEELQALRRQRAAADGALWLLWLAPAGLVASGNARGASSAGTAGAEDG